MQVSSCASPLVSNGEEMKGPPCRQRVLRRHEFCARFRSPRLLEPSGGHAEKLWCPKVALVFWMPRDSQCYPDRNSFPDCWAGLSQSGSLQLQARAWASRATKPMPRSSLAASFRASSCRNFTLEAGCPVGRTMKATPGGSGNSIPW